LHGCLGLLFPNSLIYIYALIPIKAKWAVLAYVVYELFWVFKTMRAITWLTGRIWAGPGWPSISFYWRKQTEKFSTEPLSDTNVNHFVKEPIKGRQAYGCEEENYRKRMY
jgi:hypothetical protein